VRIHGTKAELGHLRAIHEYAAQDSKGCALKPVDRLTQRSQQTDVYPRSGRVVPEYGREDIRELIEPPFRIIYRVKKARIDVLAVVHGARQMPPDMPS